MLCAYLFINVFCTYLSLRGGFALPVDSPVVVATVVVVEYTWEEETPPPPLALAVSIIDDLLFQNIYFNHLMYNARFM